MSGDDATLAALDGVFGALFSPSSTGGIRDLSSGIETVHHKGALCVVDIDPLAAVLLRSAGPMGADIAIGSAQRFECRWVEADPMQRLLQSQKARTLDPWTTRRCKCRRRRSPRPPPRITNSRATYSSREGNIEYLHGAGALANIAGLYACWHGLMASVR